MTTRRALWMQKLAEEVVRGVTARVESGETPPGTLLGASEDIARDYVTGIGVVERALEDLEDAGVVTVGPEGNVVVAGPPLPSPGFALSRDDLAQLPDVIAILELRLGLEAEAVALAAARRTEPQLAEIRAAAESHAAAAGQGERPAQADFRFHRAIASASGNGYILELLDYLGPLLIPRMRIPMPVESGAGDRNLAASIREHAAIVAAIEGRDVAGARQAMHAHLQRTIDLLNGFGPAGNGA